MSAGFHTVHVRVNDAATGQPTPCRVRFTGPDGTYYAPFGRQTEFARGWNEDVGGNLHIERWTVDAKGRRQLDARKYAFIDGTCEIRLPGGRIRVEVHKGPEYKPVFQEINQPLGKMTLRLTLERWIDLRAEGWYSGDTRCHLLTPHAALLEGAAEDVALVNLLAQELDVRAVAEYKDSGRITWTSYRAVPNLLAFSGQRPALELPGHMVVVNTLNYHGLSSDLRDSPACLGKLSLLNCHRVVYPLRFGPTFRKVRGRFRLEGWDDWTLADWCDQCHRKGGLVVWSDIQWNPEAGCYSGGEALADVILGRVDALEVEPFHSFGTFACWYALLNCGYQIPLAGASGKSWNNLPVGFMRTYARLREGEPLSYARWIEAVRAGQSFVTMGPLLRFTVDGQEPGSVLHLPRTGTVLVRAEVRSLEPFASLDLVVNGNVIKTVKPTGSPLSAVLEREVKISTNSWLAASCRYEPLGEQGFLMMCLDHAAHTSPVYVRIADRPTRADRKAVATLDAALKEMLEWVRNHARCKTEQQRENLAAIFSDARKRLTRRTGGRESE